MGREMEIIAEGGKYAAGNLGGLSAGLLAEYAFPNPAGGMLPGKVFLAESLGASGMEVSFSVMPPKTGMPFFHKHRKNEEMYVILKGCGEFEIDGDVVSVMEGSCVRIAPGGSRSWKNTGAVPMVMLCIQAGAGTLDSFSVSDGVPV